MMSKDNFDKILKPTIISLKMIGVNILAPKPTKQIEVLKQTWWFYFLTIWLYQDVLGEIYWFVEGIQLKKSFSELTFIAPCIVFGFVSTVKVAAIFKNRFTAKKVLDELKRLQYEEFITNDKSKIDILENCKKMSTKLLSILFWPNLGNVLLFIFFPLCVSLSSYVRSGKWVYVLPFTIKYPFDPYNITLWPWVYLHQFISCLAVVTNMFSSDTFYCLSCIQVQMQFKLLKVDYERLMDKTKNFTDDQIYDKLLALIKQHQELIRLVSLVEEVFTVSNLYNYAFSSFLICLSGYNATTNTEPDVLVPFSLFLLSNLAQIFLLCYFGDMVMRSSTELSLGVYFSKWHSAPLKVQRALLIVLRRTQKPCTLTAVRYVTIDLNTFTKIIGTAWSYFALLKTIDLP